MSGGSARVAGVEAPLALYRRYRPETFAEVIGQDHVTAPLRNALSNNRVNHAYLFSGPRGCGKTTSARILARAINCEKGPIAEPCGVCKSCTDLARGGPGSIDVIEIDAASHGGVDDARDLRERAFFAPVESRYKIYIIDEAHMVTTQGFNALLKLVEEPPPHLKFIFATTEPDKVIGTIRSRTHHYPFRLVPPKVLADYMAKLCESEGVAIESAALPLVVRAGAGSVRDSLSVLDQLIGGAGPEGVTYELAVALLGFTPDSLLDACVDGFAAHDSAAVFETIEKVIETGQDPKRFAEDLLRRLRDLVVLSAVPNAVVSGLIEAAEDQGERLQTQAAGIGPAELTRAADIVAAGLLEMRGATAPRLQLELICAKVLLPGADDSTNGIQARLDRMERRLAIGAPAGTPDAAHPATSTSRAGQPLATGGGTPGAGAPGGAADYTSAGAPGADAASSRAAARAAATAGGAGAATATGPAAAGPAGSGSAGGAAAGAGGAAGGAGGAVGGAGGVSADGGAGVAGAGGGTGVAGAGDGAGDAGGAVAAGGGLGAGGAGAGSAPAGARQAGAANAAPNGPSAGVGSAGGGGRTGAWGDGADVAPGGAAPSDVAAGGAGSAGGGAAGGGASGGAVGLADIRRLWPEVLEAVKTKRRFAWIMLSQNAQVIAIDDQTLTLGLVNAGARESFARSGSDEILRQAMNDTIGIDRRVEAVVDPSSDPGAGGPGGSGGPGGRPGGGHGGGAPGGGPGGVGGGAQGGPGGVGQGSTGGAPVGGGGAPGDGGAGGPATGAFGPGGSGAALGGGVDAAGPAEGGSGMAGSGMAGSGTGGPGVAGLDGASAGGARDAGGDAAGGGVGGHGVGAAGGGADAAGMAGGAERAGVAGGFGADRHGQPGTGAVDGAGGFGGPGAGSGADASAGGVGTAAPRGAGGAERGAGLGGAEFGSGGAGGPASTAGQPGAGGAGRPGTGGSGQPGAGGPGAGGAGASAGGAGAGGRSGGWGDAAGSVALREPPESEYDVPAGADPWEASGGVQPAPVDRREQAASKRRAAEAAVAAEQARAAARAPVVPEVPLTPEEEAASIGEDDMVLDDDPRTHTELLRETLGAQMITEEAN
ncbi:DNA polymerase III subunit gamma and tau [Kribbella sp. NPDC049584]|uniref:DNA polymerase III subunit gamma and tau n=1 Tax=Kribbella sp. NPDC049584 TaxID=3154833 RepID=UPI00341B580F